MWCGVPRVGCLTLSGSQSGSQSEKFENHCTSRGRRLGRDDDEERRPNLMILAQREERGFVTQQHEAVSTFSPRICKLHAAPTYTAKGGHTHTHTHTPLSGATGSINRRGKKGGEKKAEERSRKKNDD